MEFVVTVLEELGTLFCEVHVCIFCQLMQRCCGTLTSWYSSDMVSVAHDGF